MLFRVPWRRQVDCPARLSIHHVGGRDGSRRFPALNSFETDIVNVLYEADRSAITEMEQQVKLLESQQIIISACVGPSNETVSFYQLWNSAASSYLPVSSDFRNNYAFLTEDVLDYDDAAWDPVSVVDLDTISLDCLILDDRKAPPPDFLSINTQGSECEILKGAKALMSRNVLAVQTEVSFPKIYERQASLDEITDVLKQAGFRIALLNQHGLRGHGFNLFGKPTRTPIGLRGGGSVIQADAIYIKDPQFIIDRHDDPVSDLVKAIFLGFVLECFDYCYACADAIQKIPDDRRHHSSSLRYVAFVNEYIEAVSKYPRIFPPVWTSMFAAVSGARREAAEIRRSYFQDVDKEEFGQAIKTLTDPEFFGVEVIADKYGLSHQATALRHARLASTWNNLRYLGLVDDKEGGVVELHMERIFE